MKPKHSVFLPVGVVVLLGCLLVGATLGTVIPQGLAPEAYLRLFPQAGRFILQAGLDDLAGAPGWIHGLTVIAALFLAGFLRGGYRARQHLFRRLELASVEEVKNLSLREDFPAQTWAPPQTMDWRVRDLETGGRLWFRASGRVALLGGLLIHLGFAGLLIGGVVDGHWGASIVVRGQAGERIPIPSPVGLRAMAEAEHVLQKSRRLDRLRNLGPQMEPWGHLESEASGLRERSARLAEMIQQAQLHPALRLNLDEVVRENPVSPAVGPSAPQWVRFTLEDDDHARIQGELRMNLPFRRSPFHFHLVDWKTGFAEITFRVLPSPLLNLVPQEALAVTASPSFASSSLPLSGSPDSDSNAVIPPELTLIASPGIPVQPSWSPLSFVLLDFWPDFQISQDHFTTRTNDLENPAARLAVYDDKGKSIGRVWAVASGSEAPIPTEADDLPLRVQFIKAASTHEAGILVGYFPGKPLVRLGGFLLTLGLLLRCLFRYEEEWVYVRPSGRMTLAVIGDSPHGALRCRFASLRETVVLVQPHPVNPGSGAGKPS